MGYYVVSLLCAGVVVAFAVSAFHAGGMSYDILFGISMLTMLFIGAIEYAFCQLRDRLDRLISLLSSRSTEDESVSK